MSPKVHPDWPILMSPETIDFVAPRQSGSVCCDACSLLTGEFEASANAPLPCASLCPVPIRRAAEFFAKCAFLNRLQDTHRVHIGSHGLSRVGPSGPLRGFPSYASCMSCFSGTNPHVDWAFQLRSSTERRADIEELVQTKFLSYVRIAIFCMMSWAALFSCFLLQVSDRRYGYSLPRSGVSLPPAKFASRK